MGRFFFLSGDPLRWVVIFPFWSQISLVDPLLWVVFFPFWSQISLMDPLRWVVFFPFWSQISLVDPLLWFVFFSFLVSNFACGSTSLARFFLSGLKFRLWIHFSGSFFFPFWSQISLVDPLRWVVFFLSGLKFRLWIHFSGSFFFSFLVSNFACGSTSLGRFSSFLVS